MHSQAVLGVDVQNEFRHIGDQDLPIPAHDVDVLRRVFNDVNQFPDHRGKDAGDQ